MKVLSSLVFVCQRMSFGTAARRHCLLLDIDLNTWLTALVDDLEGKVLDVTLDILVIVLATDQTLDVVDGSFRVGRELVLG